MGGGGRSWQIVRVFIPSFDEDAVAQFVFMFVFCVENGKYSSFAICSSDFPRCC